MRTSTLLLSISPLILAACVPSAQAPNQASSSSNQEMSMMTSSEAASVAMPSSRAVPPPASSKAQVKPATVSVSIKGFAFSRANLTVKQGTTVVWTNEDNAPHTVTGDNGGPNSPSLGNGQSYRYTFDAVGTFPYHCAVHPMMTATVTVTP